MEPIHPPSSNFTYKGPAADIGDLPCEVGTVRGDEFCPGVAPEQPGDRPVCYAVYEPTDRERAAIASGHNIKLGIYAMPIPPVSLSVTDEGRV
jgi:hypothetical protein